MSRTKRVIKLSSVLLGLLGSVAVAVFPALFMYFQNAGEAHFGDIVPVMLIFSVIGAALYGLTLLITRKPAKAGLITALFLMVFLNYTLIEYIIQKVFPELRYWHIAPILLVLLLHAAWAICKWMPDDIGDILMPVLNGVLAFLIAFNGVVAIPKITTRVKAEQEAKRLSEQVSVSEKEMPNFYFILFDEFSTIPFMEKYFNYDNTELLNKLEKIGFNISQSGHNFTSSTAIVTADLFQLNYVAGEDLSKSEELYGLRSNNPVFDHLREAGYEVVSPAGAAFYGLNDVLGKSANAKTIKGEDIKLLLLKNTVIYPFLTRQSLGEAKQIIDELDYMKNPRNFPEHNQFTLAHFILPHEPFLFYANGSIRETASNTWRDLDFYLQQYQFASRQIYEIAENITQNDPNAIIWILSDHSARASSDPDLVGIFANEDMTNFFNALYYQGEKLDIEGMSGVNTFRLILNKLLHTNYEMVSLP